LSSESIAYNAVVIIGALKQKAVEEKRAAEDSPPPRLWDGRS